MQKSNVSIPFQVPVRKVISNTKVCRKCRLFLHEIVPVLKPGMGAELRRRGYVLTRMVKLECPNGCHLKYPNKFLGEMVGEFQLSGGHIMNVKAWPNRGSR